MQLPMFIHSTHIAALLGLRDATAFMEQRDMLLRDHAFPTPMPQSRRPLLWRADQVLLWIERQGLPAPAMQTPAPSGPNVYLLHRAATP